MAMRAALLAVVFAFCVAVHYTDGIRTKVGESRSEEEAVSKKGKPAKQGHFIGSPMPFNANQTDLQSSIVDIDPKSGVLTPLCDDQLEMAHESTAYNAASGDLFLFTGTFFNTYNTKTGRCLTDVDSYTDIDMSKCNPPGQSCLDYPMWSSKLNKAVALAMGYPWNPEKPISSIVAIDVYNAKEGPDGRKLAPMQVISNPISIDLGVYEDSTAVDNVNNKLYSVMAGQTDPPTLYEFALDTGSVRAVKLEGGAVAPFPLVAIGDGTLVGYAAGDQKTLAKLIRIDTKTGKWHELLKQSEHLPGLPSVESLGYNPKSNEVIMYTIDMEKIFYVTVEVDSGSLTSKQVSHVPRFIHYIT